MNKRLIIIRFKNKMMTPREYIAFSKEILLKLESFHPVFKNLFGWGTEPTSKSIFNKDKSNFEEIVFSQIADPELAYINRDEADKTMHLDSYSRSHYGNSYSNIEKVDDGRVTVNITCGSNEKEVGNFFIELPTAELSEFGDLHFVSKLFKLCLEFFETPIYGVVITEDFRRRVRKSEFSYWIGLINYFSSKDLFNTLPSSTIKEHFLNGTLFYLDAKIDFSENEEMVNRALQIRDLLGEKGHLV
ncbi:hypothetical protein [Chryseobacterium rhizosphaerae]|uniref:Immunity protein 52 domain-containing protein n=1 Tax=Chryseobacterium rhizosphaerae TaxID=395937 RepID=A0ABX9IJE9_9FLAO|nr:hypothetical protein [Chryseobacterium rhizosphaerae]REC74523.1 hypothetical protein DRF57_13590 [Chryseobacterium rhizosphaerae]GEN66005.1 hypothetical protein CRH01_05730 [Chryseobacterium rhizosphaerae]